MKEIPNAALQHFTSHHFLKKKQKQLHALLIYALKFN